MHLYLINPRNAASVTVETDKSRFNRYAIWKPLGLLILARLTPSEWDVTIIDENIARSDYASLPRPDLVGITAFSSQAPRAYKVAAEFRRRGVPVIMGGIHATVCTDEVLKHVDAAVTGEAEEVWAQVLKDALEGELRPIYHGSVVDIEKIPPARHDLLDSGYTFGSIQTTRGCPLDCHYCSVAAVNGRRYRRRPIEQVIEEFKMIRESRVLIVDDNLIGTTNCQITYAKDLFRAMIAANLRKKWIGQATINMGDDEELVRLAASSGCFGLLIGFESATTAGLAELNKNFNAREPCVVSRSIRRLQRHGIAVYGTFILGLDVDQKGIGRQLAQAAEAYGVDLLSANFMTPLPGTRLWDRMQARGRIGANQFPADWKNYTLALPVAHYMHLSWADMVAEFLSCHRTFYAYPRIFARFIQRLIRTRKVRTNLICLACNLVFRHNIRLDIQRFKRLDMTQGAAYLLMDSGRQPRSLRDN